MANDLVAVRYPVSGPVAISGRYLQSDDVWTPEDPHLGVDFDIPTGTDVLSMTIAPSKVHAVHRATDTDWGNGSFGNCVVVDVLPAEPGGWYYIYAHLSAVLVTAGDMIAPGQVIARSGASGKVTGPHLHVQKSRNAGFPKDRAQTGDPLQGIPSAPPAPTPAVTLEQIYQLLLQVKGQSDQQGVSLGNLNTEVIRMRDALRKV